jgi:molecular chaperone GrpE (heat shock protein)
MNVPCGDGEKPNCVKQVLKKGYKQGEKVIRFAQVVVTI